MSYQHGDKALMCACPAGDGLFDVPGPMAPPADVADPARKADGTTHPAPLAAGIAHDLGNLLTVVLGSLEQLRRQPLAPRGQQQLDRAQWGARQAARLTRQVLASARGEDAADVVDLNEAVGSFGEMVGQAAGNGVPLAVKTAPGPLLARVDAGELELVLLNLVRNAADATASGGRVTISTAGHRMDGLGGQPTVMIAVSDTGTGMSSEVVRHAADPFFTTKEPGRGTGLGLWLAQRFAAETGGKMEIETVPGLGTTVRVVLPRVWAEQRDGAPG